MKKANIVLDNQSTGLTIIEKMSFEDVDVVFDVLHDVFHPNGLDEDKDEHPDARFLALWTLFLSSVGWTDDEYWEEWKSRPHHCHDCGAQIDKDGNHIDEDGVVINKDDKQAPPASKPN
jgi:hypothetical protein